MSLLTEDGGVLLTEDGSALLTEDGGSGAPSANPDLIALSEATAALADLGLSTAQLSYLPDAIAAASATVRRHCGDRDFDQRAYDAIYSVGLDGTISLPQVPVLKVSRVSAGRTQAIAITNADRATNQRATVEFDCTGDELAGITYTGLTLTRVASGVATAVNLTFATYPTLGSLATAVNALGHGWAATVGQDYPPWASTELIDQDDAAQDCFAGASLDVWGEDLAGCKLTKRTGILAVGTGRTLGVDGPRWGYDWQNFAEEERETWSKVRVSYTAGFATVPGPVKQAVALVVSGMMSALRTDPRLSSETDGAYSYVINTAFGDYAIPKAALGLLSPYVLHRT